MAELSEICASFAEAAEIFDSWNAILVPHHHYSPRLGPSNSFLFPESEIAATMELLQG